MYDDDNIDLETLELLEALLIGTDRKPKEKFDIKDLKHFSLDGHKVWFSSKKLVL